MDVQCIYINALLNSKKYSGSDGFVNAWSLNRIDTLKPVKLFLCSFLQCHLFKFLFVMVP